MPSGSCWRASRRGRPAPAARGTTLGGPTCSNGDLTGADTALTRAQDLAPTCTKDIQLLRRNTWIVLVNAGIGFMKDKNNDSAAVLFRQANVIYRGEPNAYTNLGVLFNSTGQPDSAIVYFRKAVEAAGTDPKSVETRDQSQYNLAALLSNQGRWPERWRRGSST